MHLQLNVYAPGFGDFGEIVGALYTLQFLKVERPRSWFPGGNVLGSRVPWFTAGVGLESADGLTHKGCPILKASGSF